MFQGQMLNFFRRERGRLYPAFPLLPILGLSHVLAIRPPARPFWVVKDSNTFSSAAMMTNRLEVFSHAHFSDLDEVVVPFSLK